MAKAARRRKARVRSGFRTNNTRDEHADLEQLTADASLPPRFAPMYPRLSDGPQRNACYLLRPEARQISGGQSIRALARGAGRPGCQETALPPLHCRLWPSHEGQTTCEQMR